MQRIFPDSALFRLRAQCRDAQLRLPTAPRREMEIAEKERLGIARQVSKGKNDKKTTGKTDQEAESPRYVVMGIN
jgi:hypothetical protein